MYINRTCEDMILKTGQSFACIVIYGPRQVGKSTTINHLFGEKYKSITLDDLETRSLAEGNPRLFLESFGWPLVIDEIQKVPSLLDEIKKKIDEQKLKWLKNDEPRQLMYILTGSNRFELQQSISESLAGRCGVIEMNSFSQAEKDKRKEPLFEPEIGCIKTIENNGIPYKTREEIFNEIFKGGMPEICTGLAERESYYKSYVNTYIEKDVRKLIKASSELLFRNFISITALRTAQELHYDDIAKSVGIDVRTCKEWISILETSGIIYLLYPYMANISNRIIKTPKLYFMDTGLCAFLCKWPNAAMLADCAMNGAFFETYVISEWIKNYISYNKDPRNYLYYYRDIDKKEVDILYVDADSITPVEIKSGVKPQKPARNFSVLSKYKMQIKPGIIIDCSDKIMPVNETSYHVPVSLIP